MYKDPKYYLYVLYFNVFFVSKSHYIDQAVFEFFILLSQLPECCGCRHEHHA